MYRPLRTLASVAFVLALTSCADGGLLSPGARDPSFAAGGNGQYLRDLDAQAAVGPDTTVFVGDVLQLGLGAGDGNGAQNNKNVRWTTSDEAVVSVAPDRGKATLVALAAGTAVVTATLGGTSVAVTITVATANTPPVAAADAFDAIGDVTVPVAAPGVLVNDTDAEGGLQATP